MRKLLQWLVTFMNGAAKIEGRDLDHWLEAQRIVNALWKIAGPDGEKYIQINVPVIKAEKWKK